ncbi:hypothetical protein BURCENBC7_AP2256 [Burkholderia cenocepacia BC7]|nr:hypothetical protein BURCENK562V_C4099 [Burkholderia cenocepacia K56-2Valvano]ERI25987.1 hypothetical protein BURCENBC7_AP2256 [Burkholderia cenocepacia BC7]
MTSNGGRWHAGRVPPCGLHGHEAASGDRWKALLEKNRPYA